VSNVDDLSKRLAEQVAKTPSQLERLAEITSRAENAPCGFHAQNPATGTLGQCISPAETTVIVAVAMPDGTFKGAGVRVEVCGRHANELEGTYKAIPAVAAEPSARSTL
jgi:hypothetical protein